MRLRCGGFRLGWARLTISTYDFYLFAYNHCEFVCYINISYAIQPCRRVQVRVFVCVNWDFINIPDSPLPFLFAHPCPAVSSSSLYRPLDISHIRQTHGQPCSAQIRSNTNRPNITLNLPFRMPENVSSFFWPFAVHAAVAIARFQFSCHVSCSEWFDLANNAAELGHDCQFMLSLNLPHCNGPDSSAPHHTTHTHTRAPIFAPKIAESPRKLILFARRPYTFNEIISL